MVHFCRYRCNIATFPGYRQTQQIWRPSAIFAIERSHRSGKMDADLQCASMERDTVGTWYKASRYVNSTKNNCTQGLLAWALPNGQQYATRVAFLSCAMSLTLLLFCLTRTANLASMVYLRRQSMDVID